MAGAVSTHTSDLQLSAVSLPVYTVLPSHGSYLPLVSNDWARLNANMFYTFPVSSLDLLGQILKQVKTVEPLRRLTKVAHCGQVQQEMPLLSLCAMTWPFMGQRT